MQLSDVVAVGLDTPGPASASGVLSAKGATNFVHANWSGYDIRGNLEKRLGKPVTYLNDGNAGCVVGAFLDFRSEQQGDFDFRDDRHRPGRRRDHRRSNVVKGRVGFGGELGHVLIPYQSIAGIEGSEAASAIAAESGIWNRCARSRRSGNRCCRIFCRSIRGTSWRSAPTHGKAAKLVRGLAVKGDPMCREIFRVQAHALGLFFDEMVNTFDPDALIIGGGALETGRGISAVVSGGDSEGHATAARKSKRTFRFT